MENFLKIQIGEILGTFNTVDLVVQKLINDVGVSEVRDLSLVKYEDLIDVLKPIQIRRLLKVWETKDIPDVLSDGSDTSSLTFDNNVQNSSKMINWEAFEIPWNKLPVKLLKSLNNGERPTPQLRRVLVRTVSDKMHKLCHLPGRKAINVISSRIVEKYPSLKDMLCGDVVGLGYCSFSKQLENRFANLNRGLGCSSKNTKIVENPDGDTSSFSETTNDSEDPDDFNKPLKKKKASSYGCLNWQPDIPPNETAISQNKKQTELLKLHQLGPKANDPQIIKLMRETFYTQRLHINRNFTTIQLLEKWPLLFSTLGLYQHFEMLLGFNIKEVFDNELKIKGKKTVDCLMSVPVGSNKKLENVVKTIKKHQEGADVKAAFMLMLIQGYFGENGTIFKIVDSTTCSNDLGVTDLPSTPCLIACGENLFECNQFMVSVDKTVINDDIQNFEDGFLIMFAAFYCLNICYPLSDGCTLEFIQRCFMGINPDRGSKLDKKKGHMSTVNPNVLRLINTIASHEWLNCNSNT